MHPHLFPHSSPDPPYPPPPYSTFDPNQPRPQQQQLPQQQQQLPFTAPSPSPIPPPSYSSQPPPSFQPFSSLATSFPLPPPPSSNPFLSPPVEPFVTSDFVPEEEEEEIFQPTSDPKDAPLTCGICFKFMKLPTIIGYCGHTYCKECLRNMNKRVLTCPACKKVYTLGKEGVEKLKVNFQINNLIEKRKEQLRNERDLIDFTSDRKEEKTQSGGEEKKEDKPVDKKKEERGKLKDY